MSKSAIAAGVVAGFVIGCAVGAIAHEASATLPGRAAGSTEILKAKLESVDGVEVIISDVVIPPNSGLPKHYHAGEEFGYVIEGEITHVEADVADRVYRAGEAIHIRRGRIHSPKTGDAPARAIVFRVHLEGQPERILVEE